MGKSKREYEWEFVGNLERGGRMRYIFKHKVHKSLMETSSLRKAKELVPEL